MLHSVHPYLHFLRLWLAVLALFAAGSVCAQSTFSDNNDGTVSDSATGLMWDKCTWGQAGYTDCASNGNAGDGYGASTHTYTWQQALAVAASANSGAGYKGHTDWRLPSRTELESLVDINKASAPAINTTVFPNTQSSWYWSSTIYTPYPASAWYVNFVNGGTDAGYQSYVNHVRLVRSGQSLDTFDALAPAVSAISPTSGSPLGGTSVTISGTQFTGATAVSIGGVAVTGLTVVNDTTITATTPAGTAGAKDVVVTTPEGSGTGSGLFTYLATASYTVTYDGNGGSGSMSAQSANVATALTANSFTRSGYTFSGWNTVAGGSGTAYANSASYAFTADVTLYAQWTALCGSANGVATAFAPAAANLCAGGSTASAVTAASPWAWTCTAGSNTAACSAPNATLPGGGVGQALVSGGAWAVDPAQSAGFIPTSGHIKSPPSLPANVSFAQGLFAITLTGGTSASTATVTITFPNAFPVGTQYWKYGKTAATPSAHWYVFSGAVFAGNSVTLTLTDGGEGDDDLPANGTIVDPGGPGLYTPPGSPPDNDTTPDPFSFIDVLQQPLGVSLESNTITVRGIDSGAYLSISGGEYRIGSGAWSSGAGWVYNGQTVTLRHTTATTAGGTVNTTLTIGGVSDTFSSTTLNKQAPTLGSVPAQNGLLGVAFSLALASYVTPTDGDPIVSYALASGTLPPGVSLNSTSGLLSGTPTTAGRYTASVTASDRDGASNAAALSFTIDSTTPAPFAFVPQNGLPRRTVVTSNAITLQGLTLPVPISVSNGLYSLNGAAFTVVAGTVSNGASVRLQLTSAASYASTATAMLSIGRGSGNFTVSTHAAGMADAFTFTPVFGAALSTLYASNSVTLTGFDGPLTLAVSGGEYALNGGAYTALAGNVRAGDTVRLRGMSSAQRGGRTSVVLTVGETSASFNIRTLGGFMPWLPVLLN